MLKHKYAYAILEYAEHMSTWCLQCVHTMARGVLDEVERNSKIDLEQVVHDV